MKRIKKTVLLSALVASASVLATFAFIKTSKTIFAPEAEEMTYTLNLSASENKLDVDAVGTRKERIFLSNTKENDFAHVVYNAQMADGYWGKMLADGYLTPKVEFSSIKSFKAVFDTADSLRLNLAGSSSQLYGNNAGDQANIDGFYIVSGTTYDFSSSWINAYEIYSVKTVNITSLTITYTCLRNQDSSRYGVLEENGSHIKLSGTSSRSDISYYGIAGKCLPGNALKISFTGKNMPNVCLFADSASGQAIGNGKGILFLTSFIQNMDGDSTNSSRMMPYAPYRWSNSASDLTTYRYGDSALSGAGYSSSSDSESSYLSFSILDFTDTTKANIQITFSHGSTVVSKYLQIDTAKNGTDEKLYDNKNIIIYGQGFTTEFDYSLDSEVASNATKNSDGTITLTKGTISGSGTSRSANHGYLGLKGDYNIGSEITIFFKGKNMPNVCLFADSAYGSQFGGGKGIYLASDTGDNRATYNERLTVYAPYRLAKAGTENFPSEYRIATPSPTSKNPFGFSCLSDSINYKYTISLDSLAYNLSVQITCNLYNADTGDSLGNAVINSIYNQHDTSVLLQDAHNIIFYGQYKDVTFSYFVTQKSKLSENATFGNDGSVTLAAGSSDGTQSKLAYVGEYGFVSGSQATVNFKGKNIPNVGLLCDYAGGQAISTANKGIYLGSSVLKSESAYDVYNKRLTVYGPRRWSLSGEDRLTKSRITVYGDSKFGYNNLDENTEYRYTVSLDSVSSTHVKFTVSLYDVTNSVTLETRVFDQDYNTRSDLEAVDLSKYNGIVFYGQHEAINFTYSIARKSVQSVEEMHTFAYASPTDGKYTENGVSKDTGEDYRTVERYREYKEAGMDTLLLQANDPYRGTEVWSTCQTKKNLDNAEAAGLKRAIVFDNRIYKLSQSTSSLIGEDAEFASMDALIATLEEYMKDYSTHPIFSGVMLVDEPSASYFDAIGEIETALQAIDESYEGYCNLLPYYATQKQLFGSEDTSISQYQAYTNYIQEFCDKVPQKTIIMDSYPLRYNSSTKANYFNPKHFPGVQIISDVATKNNRNPGLVIQSSGCTKGEGGDYVFVPPSASDMRMQYNSALAFGMKTIGYFTYWRKVSNSESEFWVDGSSFVTSNGTKTAIYDAVQKITNETTTLRKELAKYKYDGSSFINSTISGDASSETISGIDVSSNASLLVTKLSNGNDSMYCIVNIHDPYATSSSETDVSINVSSDEFGIYQNGIYKKGSASKGYRTSLEAGEALFLEVNS